MNYAIKAHIVELQARTFVFRAQKTLYGGRRIAAGDTLFIFASENEGGPGAARDGAELQVLPPGD